MKRCPKCNRSFPEENQKFCTVDGGLLITEQTFDPNMTIRATAADLVNSPAYSDDAATSRKLPDIGAITASGEKKPASPRSTGPTGTPTSSPLPPLSAAAAPGPAVQGETKKKSKLPLILGILAVLLLLGIGGIAGVFFFVIKPRLDEMRDRQGVVVRTAPPVVETNTNVNTTANTNNSNEATIPTEPAFVPPADATEFANSKDKIEGKLADHYVDFSFYYPQSWQVDPKAGVAGSNNFTRVERVLPPDFTQEEFAVGWYGSKGTYEADLPVFPKLVELLSSNLAKRYPEYRQVSEGPTKINSKDAYEFRFVSLSKGTEKGDIQIWGRVVFVPTGNPEDTSGATLSMLATSLAPDLSGVADVGAKGEMPVILDSFRFGKK